MADEKPRCGRRTRAGRPCRGYSVHGSPGAPCRAHGGNAPHVNAHHAVRGELLRWGLGDAHQDPGEVLLRLVAQSAARVEHYAQLLEHAFAAAERLQAAHDAQQLLVADHDPADEDDVEPAALQQARLDLDRIFTTGGVAALIGYKYDATSSGHLYAADEGIRGLAQLEAAERDRCANFAAKAIAAGLNKRMVELAEGQGRLIADLLRAVLADEELGLTVEQRRAIPDVARRHLALAR